MKDWIESVVVMQPLTRKLEEELNRREYAAAEGTARQLCDLCFDVQRYCIAAQVRSGEGVI